MHRINLKIPSISKSAIKIQLLIAAYWDLVILRNASYKSQNSLNLKISYKNTIADCGILGSGDFKKCIV